MLLCVHNGQRPLIRSARSVCDAHTLCTVLFYSSLTVIAFPFLPSFPQLHATFHSRPLLVLHGSTRGRRTRSLPAGHLHLLRSTTQEARQDRHSEHPLDGQPDVLSRVGARTAHVERHEWLRRVVVAAAAQTAACHRVQSFINSLHRRARRRRVRQSLPRRVGHAARRRAANRDQNA